VSAATYTPEMGERIAALLSEWKLPMVAGEQVRRLLAGGHGDALMVVAEVLELEAAGRKERRVERLRRASKLPPGKTFETRDVEVERAGGGSAHRGASDSSKALVFRRGEDRAA
jgi:hypothetical protein